jgi:hypothetical protein
VGRAAADSAARSGVADVDVRLSHTYRRARHGIIGVRRARRSLIESLEGRTLFASFPPPAARAAPPPLAFPISANDFAAGQPSVVSTTPADAATNVARDAFISANLAVSGSGIDPRTLSADSVKLYRTTDGVQVAASLNTSAGGDVLALSPSTQLDADTDYTFEVTTNLKDLAGLSFTPMLVHFRTGSGSSSMPDGSLSFEKVPLSAVAPGSYTAVAKGPDGKLYAGTETGEIVRFDILEGGTLANPQTIHSLIDAAGGLPRMLTGIAFDPASTAGDLVLWVTHSHYAIDNAPDWTGKVSRLSGPDLGVVEDYVVGLPRSTRDHVANQLTFGPDGAIYFAQPSNTAMGAPDSAWHFRPEHYLTAAILRLDVGLVRDRIAAGQGPINVKTEEGGTYNPHEPGAPLTLFATGVRNAYDLLWHSNGFLYAPTNGSQLGGATPAGDGVPGIDFVNQVEDDFLFRIESGRYYGHPNPTRHQYVMDGGNPTAGPDPQEISQYPVGTMPGAAYHEPVYDFGQHYSPDGVIEYRGMAFGGALDHKILVARYSGGDDVVVLTVNDQGQVTDARSGIEGLKNFNDPLDLAEDPSTGFIYVTEFGAQTITLVKPTVPAGAPADVPPNPHPSAPLGPYGLVVKSTGGSKMELNWRDSVGESGYKIERTVNGTSNWTEVGRTSANETRFVDAGLSRSTTYAYRVRAFNDLGDSKYSAGATGTSPDVFLPAGWDAADVGNVGRSGTASVDDAGGVFEVKGSGAADDPLGAFFFASVPATGDVEIVARVSALQAGEPTAYAGLMIRSGNAADSPSVAVDLTAGFGAEYLVRPSEGAAVTRIRDGNLGASAPIWLRLVRRGDTVSGYVARDEAGLNWERVAFAKTAVGDPVQIGLAVSSANGGQLASATFDNVRINAAPALDVPQSPIGLSATANGSSVALSWTDASVDETGFAVERRRAGSGGAWVRVGETGAETTGYVDERLAGSRKYEYRLRALDGAGESAPSGTAAVKTPKSPVKTQAPFSGSPADLSGVIEAEAFDDGVKGKAFKDRSPDNDLGAFRDSGADIERTTDPDGGSFDVVASKGEWLAYTVNVPAEGTYTVELRIAADADHRGTASVQSGGKNVTVGGGSFDLPATGGWNVWQTATGTINLKAGVQVLRLCIDGADNVDLVAARVNWLRFTSAPVTDRAAPAPVAMDHASSGNLSLSEQRIAELVFFGH